MLSPEHIAEAARRLVAEAGRPAKVILFGSYARGEADDASDLDLMVVEKCFMTPQREKAERFLRLASFLSIAYHLPEKNAKLPSSEILNK